MKNVKLAWSVAALAVTAFAILVGWLVEPYFRNAEY